MHVYLEGTELSIKITSQNAEYFKVKVLTAHLLLAVALGVTPLKEKKKKEWIFCIDFSVTAIKKAEFTRLQSVL